MSNKIPPGLDPNKVEKVDFDRFSDAQPQQQAPQQPQPPQNQQAPQQQPQPQQQAPQQPQQQQQAPQQPQQQAPQQPPKGKVDFATRQKIARNNPVLKNILNRFGLDSTKLFTNQIYLEDDQNNPVTFIQADFQESLNTWAIQEGQTKARIEGEAEGLDHYQTLLAALSVAGMDDTPIYEIFDIELFEMEKEKVSRNRYDISPRVKKLCAIELAELLNNELSGFAEKLMEFYIEKVQRKDLKSQLDGEKKESIHHICPETGCSFSTLDKPRLDQYGNKLPFYCKFHGTKLVGTDSLGEQKAPLD